MDRNTIKSLFKIEDLGNGWAIEKERNHKVLKKNNERIMIDHDLMFDDYEFFTKDFSGTILLGGLGLGILSLLLQDRDEITAIDIIEIDEDLINIMKNKLPFNKKVSFINANIFEYESGQYDYAYIDIFVKPQKEDIKRLEELYSSKVTNDLVIYGQNRGDGRWEFGNI